MVDRRDDDAGHELYLRTDVRGQAGQQRYGLEVAEISVQEMLAERNIGEARVYGPGYDPQGVLKLLPRADGRRNVAHQQTDLNHR